MPTTKQTVVAAAEPHCPSEARGVLAKLLQRDSPWKVSEESVQEFVAALAAAGFAIVNADAFAEIEARKADLRSDGAAEAR
jgi:hypothetical protein